MMTKAIAAMTSKCAPAPAKPFCKPRFLKERIAFAKLDRNHDRAVSRDEYLGKSAGFDRLRKEKEFQVADLNHDGKLSFKEYVLKGRQHLHDHLHTGIAICRAWLK